MTPEVEVAIAEIKAASEPQGGAYLIVQNLAIGERYIPNTTWIGFLITFQYPDADVYPHFIRGDLKRADGQSFPAGISFLGSVAIALYQDALWLRYLDVALKRAWFTSLCIIIGARRRCTSQSLIWLPMLVATRRCSILPMGGQ